MDRCLLEAWIVIFFCGYTFSPSIFAPFAVKSAIGTTSAICFAFGKVESTCTFVCDKVCSSIGPDVYGAFFRIVSSQIVSLLLQIPRGKSR